MFCGGVGGARAALALSENLPQENLTFLVNTGDDFRHLGMEIWPDWDTVFYHLAGLQEPARGWGRADEGTRFMEEMKRFRAPDWFHLGDRDIALHVYRTWALGQGKNRQELCRELCQSVQVQAQVLPVTNQSLQTKLQTTDGRTLDFQEWFVKEQTGPPVAKVINKYDDSTTLCPGVIDAIMNCEVLMLAPSNPYLSLDPVLNHPDIQTTLKDCQALKYAVSPLIGGKAVKGPLDALIVSLSRHSGQEAIIRHWSQLVDVVLMPEDEVLQSEDLGVKITPCPTLLKSAGDRKVFAQALQQIWKGESA